MSSVLIKGMKIPKNCTYCDSIGLNVAIGCPVMTGINGRATDCPLVGIPPHGRLIDADALITDIKECIEAKDSNCEWEQVQGLEVALSCIMDDAPTVIEAEEDQEE